MVAAASAPPSLDDPNSPHTPGVYILASGADGKVHMTKLDHITPKNTKTSGAFLSGMTYGIAKAHVKASIDGGMLPFRPLMNSPSSTLTSQKTTTAWGALPSLFAI